MEIRPAALTLSLSLDRSVFVRVTSAYFCGPFKIHDFEGPTAAPIIRNLLLIIKPD